MDGGGGGGVTEHTHVLVWSSSSRIARALGVAFCLFLFTTDIGLKLTLNSIQAGYGPRGGSLQVCPILTHIVFPFERSML